MLESFLSWYITTPSHKGKGRIERWLFKMLDGRFVRSVYGPELRIRAGDATNRFAITGALAKDYRDVYDEVMKLQPGQAFIDIGANLGLFSVLASGRVGPTGVVLSFEPSLRTYSDLVANLHRNSCQPVLPFNAAISTDTAIASFDPGKDDHSGVAHLSAGGAIQVVMLDGANILHLIEPLLSARETVIKIDVEGHEAQVIRSIRPLLGQPWVRRVIVEIDPTNLLENGATDQEIYKIFADHGFMPSRGIGYEPHFNEIFVKA